MMIEITFTYQNDSKSDKVTTFTYHFTNTDDLEKSIEKSKTYFKKFTKENGWTRKTKLVKIASPKNENSAPINVVVPPEPTRAPRKRSKSPRSSGTKKPVTKNKTRV